MGVGVAREKPTPFPLAEYLLWVGGGLEGILA